MSRTALKTSKIQQILPIISMNYFNLVLLLTSSIRASVPVQMDQSVELQAQAALADSKFPLRIAKNAYGNVDFYSMTSGLCMYKTNWNDISYCFKIIGQERGRFMDFYKKRKVELDAEAILVESLLGRYFTDPKYEIFRQKALQAIRRDLNDLERAKNIVYNFTDSTQVPTFDDKTYKKMIKKHRDRIADYDTIMSQLSSNQRPVLTNVFVNDFKKLLIEIKLFMKPNSKSLDPRPLDFYLPDWDKEIAKINIPAGRFRVSAIDPSLNLLIVLANNGGDFMAGVTALRNNFRALPPSPDVELRTRVFESILEQPQGGELSLDLVNKRLRAYERAVEGIVIGLSLSEQLDVNVVTEMVKAWLMSQQMFCRDGQNIVDIPLSPSATANETQSLPLATENISAPQGQSSNGPVNQVPIEQVQGAPNPVPQSQIPIQSPMGTAPSIAQQQPTPQMVIPPVLAPQQQAPIQPQMVVSPATPQQPSLTQSQMVMAPLQPVPIQPQVQQQPMIMPASPQYAVPPPQQQTQPGFTKPA